MNDKLKIIAEYDGWELKTIYPLSGKPEQKRWYHYEKTGRFSTSVLYGEEREDFMYLTSLDWLHPVAMKVKADLKKLQHKQAWNKVQNIDCMCCKPPINGEYSELFNATVDGIIYLQNRNNA